MTSSLRAKLAAVIAALFVVWALRGGRPEVIHAPFHSTIVDLLGRYLSAEQQSEEANKVMQRGLGSRQLWLSGHHCTAALGMCHGTVQAPSLPWMDFRPRVRTGFRDPRPERTRFDDGQVTAGELAAQAKHDLQLPHGARRPRTSHWTHDLSNQSTKTRQPRRPLLIASQRLNL
ncbi:MAG: hypothetical protein ACREYC_09175 [Gammaproteobacteria bacterium]